MPFVNTTPLPTTVFVAPTGTGVNALCILKNESPSQTLFVGLSACTPKTGIPLPPNESIKLNSANVELVCVLELGGGHAAGYHVVVGLHGGDDPVHDVGVGSGVAAGGDVFRGGGDDECVSAGGAVRGHVGVYDGADDDDGFAV